MTGDTMVYTICRTLSRQAIEQAACDVRALVDDDATRKLHDRIDCDGATAQHALPIIRVERLVPVEDSIDGWLPECMAQARGITTPWAQEVRRYTITAKEG